MSKEEVINRTVDAYGVYPVWASVLVLLGLSLSVKHVYRAEMGRIVKDPRITDITEKFGELPENLKIYVEGRLSQFNDQIRLEVEHHFFGLHNREVAEAVFRCLRTITQKKNYDMTEKQFDEALNAGIKDVSERFNPQMSEIIHNSLEITLKKSSDICKCVSDEYANESSILRNKLYLGEDVTAYLDNLCDLYDANLHVLSLFV